MSESDPRMTLTISADTMEWIDDYWHRYRLRSRQEAIRELMEFAMTHHDDLHRWASLRRQIDRYGAR